MSDWGNYQEAHLHAIMAGVGNPYAVLSPLRMRLLRALRDGRALDEIGHRFDLSVDRLEAELQPLIRASLVYHNAGEYQPSFLFANAQETERVSAHACGVGKLLAGTVARRWNKLEAAFAQLAMGGAKQFHEVSFFLIGDKLLDTTLLDALAADKRLMPPAPHRPAPENPEARYYFWMIEGTHDQLGKYGQRSTTLPWSHWELLTFGQKHVDGAPNAARSELETNIIEVASRSGIRTAHDLAGQMNIPLFDCDQTRLWLQAMRPHAAVLVTVYQRQEQAIRTLYISLRQGQNATHNFGEFFCWYDHLAYAGAIDQLVRMGLMHLPKQRFSAALWCEEPGERKLKFTPDSS